MKLPQAINVLGVDYAIEYVSSPTEVDIFKREALWGQCDYWTRTIRVYKNDRPIEDIFQTVVHEVLHAIAEALHLESLTNNANHDDLDVLALALTDVMFRNEWVDISGE